MTVEEAAGPAGTPKLGARREGRDISGRPPANRRASGLREDGGRVSRDGKTLNWWRDKKNCQALIALSQDLTFILRIR